MTCIGVSVFCLFLCVYTTESIDGFFFCTDNTDDYAEPENLSTKPQDLSVKWKSAAAAAFEVKKEPPSLPYHHIKLEPDASEPELASVPPPSSPSSPYHQAHRHHDADDHRRHLYQPMPVKPGPLEPLCLNVAAADNHHNHHNHHHHHHHHQQQQQQHVQHAAYHHHHHGLQAPAAPRPVPAQYPAGYLQHTAAGYHHQLYQHHEHPYPVVYAAAPPSMGRDASLSPPGGRASSCSAFKPHVPSSTTSSLQATSSCGLHSPSGSWYGRGSSDGWSPPAAVPIPTPANVSSPPPYALHQPQQQQQQQHPVVPDKPAVARYKCSSCAKTYSTASGLTKHQQNGQCAAATADDPDCAAGPPKTFSCKYCDKAYNTLGALKMHIRTHTLPCICTLCGKAFSRPWLLQGHIRTHTGEKPFSCPHCNRAFADRSNLRAHLQTHSDVKKYSCPTCSKTFSRMSLLTKHCDSGCPRVQQQQQLVVATVIQ